MRHCDLPRRDRPHPLFIHSSRPWSTAQYNPERCLGEAGLNIAEIALSCLPKQCLGRRIADLDVLNAELDAWTRAANTDERQADWEFKTRDARIKLRHLYPVLEKRRPTR